jgi:hypothetical protein
MIGRISVDARRTSNTPPDLRRLHIDAAALGFAVGRERLGIDGGWFASAPLSVVALLAGGLLAWRRLPTDVPVAPRLRAFNCARMALGGSAVCLVARLGGRLARKGDGPRGWPTLWRGWGDLHQGLPAPNSCSTDVYNDEAGGPCHDEVSRRDDRSGGGLPADGVPAVPTRRRQRHRRRRRPGRPTGRPSCRTSRGTAAGAPRTARRRWPSAGRSPTSGGSRRGAAGRAAAGRAGSSARRSRLSAIHGHDGVR